MLKVSLYEMVRVYGEYDDDNQQVATVMVKEDGCSMEVAEYNAKYYPPFSYGGKIVVGDGSSITDWYEVITEDKGEDGLLLKVFPPRGVELTRNRDLDSYERFGDD